jgi:hypothetical protein
LPRRLLHRIQPRHENQRYSYASRIVVQRLVKMPPRIRPTGNLHQDLIPWLNDRFQAPPALDGVHDLNLTLDFQGFAS